MRFFLVTMVISKDEQGFSRVLEKISLPIVEQYYVYCRLVLAFELLQKYKSSVYTQVSTIKLVS